MFPTLWDMSPILQLILDGKSQQSCCVPTYTVGFSTYPATNPGWEICCVPTLWDMSPSWEISTILLCSIILVGKSQQSFCVLILVGKSQQSFCVLILVGKSQQSFCVLILVGKSQQSCCVLILPTLRNISPI